MDVNLDKAIELVESLLGSGGWRCKPFGAGKFSQTFLVESEKNAQLVLRIAPPDTLLQLLYGFRGCIHKTAVLSAV